MTTVIPPEDGELRLGPVTLPAGRRINAAHDPSEPVVWATVAEVPDAGLAWAALSQIREQTGLVPFLLAGLDETTARPWDSGELLGRSDIGALDHMDAASVLERLWDGKTHEGDEAGWGEDEDEEFTPVHRGGDRAVLPPVPRAGSTRERTPGPRHARARSRRPAVGADRAGPGGEARGCAAPDRLVRL